VKILMLGGDGFCGWPTTLHLSRAGHDVTIVDNLSRRMIDVQLEVESLTPIRPIHERLSAWKEHTGKEIDFVDLDLAHDYDRLVALLVDTRPDAVVHFAEQRAAPYSMRDSNTKRYTIDNNVSGTHNLLCGIVESGLDVAVVHLGTMGVYGYGWSGSAPIPEGYLTVQISTPKNDGVRITDLHQGIVWGTQTPETALDERLINRFDYDGDYGTVLNRFIMQAAIGHPLTVHGTGGQTRAFIHIRDTVRCIEIALTNPPVRGEQVSIYNQVTETYQIRELANLVSELTGVEIAYLPNPRNEAVENELRVTSDRFLAMGLEATTLSDGLLEETREIGSKYASRADFSKVVAKTVWKAGMEVPPDIMN